MQEVDGAQDLGAVLGSGAGGVASAGGLAAGGFEGVPVREGVDDAASPGREGGDRAGDPQLGLGQGFVAFGQDPDTDQQTADVARTRFLREASRRPCVRPERVAASWVSRRAAVLPLSQWITDLGCAAPVRQSATGCSRGSRRPASSESRASTRARRAHRVQRPSA
ncbi:hypothetical protein B6R96_32970 [Streptomyces sp. Sge12]|nr:hypothetical protein B6R96_32970 [Streptomyces sp. Sge12]